MNETRATIHFDIFRGDFVLQIGEPNPVPGMVFEPRIVERLSPHAALRLFECLCATDLEAKNRRDADRSEQRRHLEDMRAIAFAKLEVKAP